jgi:hypothetical protein
MATTAHFATVDEPRWAGVAGQFGEAGIITLGLEFGTQGGIFLDRFSFALVALNPGCLGHKKLFFSERKAH